MCFTPRYLYSFLEKNAVKVLLGFVFLVTGDRAKTESMRQSITQFFRFCFIGLSNTLVNYLLYVACLNCIRAFGRLEYDYIVASIVAFSLSVIWSYFWNSRFVFEEGQENRTWLIALIKMYLAYSVSGILVNNLLLYIAVSVLGISVYMAPILSLFICVPVNFVLNKYWAFK